MQEPTYFYHGTSLQRATQIESEGLLIGAELTVKGIQRSPLTDTFSWAPNYCVLLTDCVAIPYALGHSGNVRDDEEGAVIRINAAALDHSLFRPTLAYVARLLLSDTERMLLSDGLYLKLTDKPNERDEDRIDRIRENLLSHQDTFQIEKFKEDWLNCLDELGECYYMSSVPPSAINDIKTVKHSDFKNLSDELRIHPFHKGGLQAVRPSHLDLLEKLFEVPQSASG